MENRDTSEENRDTSGLCWLEQNLGLEYVDGLPRKELFRIAVEHRLMSRVKNWFQYQESRNKTAYTYDQDTAQEVFKSAKKFLTDAKELLSNLKDKNV